MIMEIWKDIIGYEGLYQVSNQGQIKSLGVPKKHISRLGDLNLYQKYEIRINSRAFSSS
jgi:hypothetical protein